MIRTYLSILLLGLLIAAPAMPGERKSLTVDECIRIGLDNSKLLHASLMQVQAADARSSELNTMRLASLGLVASYTRLSEIPSFTIMNIKSTDLFPSIQDNWLARVSLQQPLFTGFRLQSSVRAADYTAQAAQYDYERNRREFAYAIRSAYWNVFQAIESEKVINENVDQVEAHLKDAKNLRSQGMATRNDILRVQVQLSQAQLLQVQARNAEQVARVALNNLIGLPLDTEVDLASRPSPPEAESQSLDALVEKAIKTRPDVKAAEARVKAAEAAVTLARAGWYPQLALTANYTYAMPNPRIIPPQDKFYDTWDAGVALSFDIWTWGRTSYQTAQARAQLNQALDGLSQLRDAVALELTQDHLDLMNAREKISVAETGVRQAKESHRVAQEGYHAGVGSNTDLLDSEVALLRARLSYTQALVDCELSLARLRKAIGE